MPLTEPVYNLEDSLERATVAALGDVAGLSSCRIVQADASSECSLPYIAVRAEKDDELVLGAGVWRMRLAVELCTAADLTDPDLEDQRRYPDTEDDDDGAVGFNALWKTLTDTMHAQAFRAAINAETLCFVWGYEVQPVTIANEDRGFCRTANISVHVSPAYDNA